MTEQQIKAYVSQVREYMHRGVDPNEALQVVANKAAMERRMGYADAKELIAFYGFGIA